MLKRKLLSLVVRESVSLKFIRTSISTIQTRDPQKNKYIIKGPVQLKNLSAEIKIPQDKIKEALQFMGISSAEIKSLINASVLELLLDHFKIPYEFLCHTPLTSSSLRSPILAIVGHVDHGKTTLLDFLRRSSIAINEIGGITQKISAFTVNVGKNEKLCFIDTPGHSTFSNVRSRGVQSTDMVVLVIASDNGIQEQTVECINLIKAAIIPYVICITKIDKKGTDIERIYNDLCKMGIEPEAVGGNVPSFEISALTGQGMKEFIEFLPKFAKKIDLSYDVTAPATGTIIDLRISSSLGKIATCILRQGKLKRGDLVSCGSTFAKVKQIILEDGKYANEVFASQPFHLVGWNSTPIPGEIFHLIDKNIKLKELQKIHKTPELKIADRVFGHSLVSGRLNHVGDSEYLTYDENNPLRINLLIKCDNYGSAEAVYQGIKHCNDPRVVINIYCCGIDNLETYTLLSVPESHTLIYTLNTEINSEAREILLKQKFAINSFEIIYKLFDHIKHYIQFEIRKAKVLKQVGAAKVLATFQLSGKLKRYVIGMKVCDGAFYNEKDVIVHIYRNNELLHQDTISSIKKLKTTVSVVNFGDECGISLKSPYKVKPGDDVVCYRLFPDERSVNWHY